MFAAQNIPLPELAPGEILAKVDQYEYRSTKTRIFLSLLFLKVRLASICMSDVHTITGHRIEPTPRYFIRC